MSEDIISYERSLGRLEGRVGAMERELRDDRAANKLVFDEMKATLADIQKTLHDSALVDASRTGHFKGGWAVLSAIGAALASLIGLAAVGLKALFTSPPS